MSATETIKKNEGATPFMVAQTMVMFLLIVFPQIVMWPLAMMTR